MQQQDKCQPPQSCPLLPPFLPPQRAPLPQLAAGALEEAQLLAVWPPPRADGPAVLPRRPLVAGSGGPGGDQHLQAPAA